MRASLLAIVLAAGCAAPPPNRCEEVLHDQLVVFAAWRHGVVVGDPPTMAWGFDLDGRVDDGTDPSCTGEEDFVSLRSGRVGVDNQYAANLLPLMLSAPTFADGVDPVVMAQLVRGEGIFGLDVTVGPDRISRVDLVTFGASGTVVVDETGHALAPDQRFHVLRRERISSRCFRDELELAWPTFDLPMGEPIGAVPLHDVHALLDVGPDGRLAGGELGARYPAEFVRDVAVALGLDVSDLDDWLIRIVAAPDLDPMSDPAICSNISLAVGFDLAPASEVP